MFNRIYQTGVFTVFYLSSSIYMSRGSIYKINRKKKFIKGIRLTPPALYPCKELRHKPTSVYPRAIYSVPPCRDCPRRKPRFLFSLFVFLE